jgi:hypothetical protein
MRHLWVNTVLRHLWIILCSQLIKGQCDQIQDIFRDSEIKSPLLVGPVMLLKYFISMLLRYFRFISKLLV